ncbi:HK97 family phage prohead protease [Streptomyces europaeiscabiei]|uniref:HK97 family phage prohead protease n=1 Tax=Streptomyces europaeiscabiei TaxID=146819 RepID=UPI0029A0A1FD|nr:HK97 family phage prohead protease [Streptomyces europaeiscabiei]MDX3582998.1 HK97 family phage prohead protease [Streptomyces europaeiscabiei]
MTDMATLRQQAAQARAGSAGSTAMAVPRDRPESPEIRFTSQLRAKKVQRDDMEWYQVEGYASAFEQGYEMWDMFGPYTEIVSKGAADKTLAADPEVVFRFNHAGTPMASTRNSRLELWADEQGLGQRAWLNPKRSDVQLLVQAIEDADVREQSFMFRITSGQWSPDYTEYRIAEFDLERGDVGPVTYGANPHTSVAARSGEFLDLIPNLPALVAREAYARLGQRSDLTVAPVPAPQMPAPARASAPAATGRSISMLRTRLLVEQGED